MLKIEKIKDEILNFDTENCKEGLDCYLSRIATNQNYSIQCYRDSDIDCSKCLKLSLVDLLEEYKKPVKLSKFEYEYLKVAKKEGFNFIARDNDGCVYLYINIPTFKGTISWGYNGEFMIVFEELFKFVKWADEEPWEIDEILNNCTIVSGDAR